MKQDVITISLAEDCPVTAGDINHNDHLMIALRITQLILTCFRFPHHGRRRGDGQVRDLHGGQPDLHERPDEQNG